MSPLTVFIGPNNSGKSYVAQLLYALSKVYLQIPFIDSYQSLSSQGVFVTRSKSMDILLNRLVDPSELQEWLRGLFMSGRNTVTWGDLPAGIQAIFPEAMESYTTAAGEPLAGFLQDYFGFEDPGELVRYGVGREGLSIRLSGTERGLPLLDLKLGTSADRWDTSWCLPDARSLAVPFPDQDFDQDFDPDDAVGFLSGLIGRYWSRQITTSGFPPQNAYYLPAARSGILNGWQVFASMALDNTRNRFGVERIDVPAFTGIARDFLQVLLSIMQRRRTSPDMAPALEALETQIFQGQVAFHPRERDRQLMVYSAGGGQLPIHRASSMVAELAPLSLWIQHVLKPGDLLIVDEPEAHLHPENQRRIARVLVRLARAGVTVLCTTHSSLILHQISNHIIASQAKQDHGPVPGYTVDDYLGLDDIGVYLFDGSEEGTMIQPVPVDPEAGIDEEEFVRVMEGIGDETYRLWANQA